MVRPTKGGHDVPPALAKRAAELVKAAKAHRVAEAKAALQDALAAHEQTVRQMFRLGTALTVLAQPGMAKDAGYASGFYPMCETVFGMGRSTVDALTKAVKAMGETRYAALKPARANALLKMFGGMPTFRLMLVETTAISNACVVPAPFAAST